MITLLKKLGLVKNVKTNNSQLIKKNLVKKDIHIFLEEVREKINDTNIKARLSTKLEQLNEEIQAKYIELQEKVVEYRKLKESHAKK